MTPFGKVASAIRSKACSLAKYGSMSYWKFISSAESPYSEMDRNASIFGMPFISTSRGMEMRRSISSAACPGHCVMISTCGGDRSGYASMGSRRKAMTPQTITAKAAIRITNRCASAKETMREIMRGL